MTTEEMLESFIQLGVRVLKKAYKTTPEGRKLDRKETITLTDGQELSCWREYIVYKLGYYINEEVPEANVEINLSGNDSNLVVELSEEEQQVLNTKIYAFLKSQGEV